ncbi:hypothetical protein AB1Y20_010759 [Prymnesium parvum]|uniref:Acyltransferase n=1 Tax=Prymnesium parvum TaxID=97485 RepID=A0AB34IT22_PRYPA
MDGPLLANLLCILAWTAPLFLLPGSVVLLTWPHGAPTVGAGLAIMAALVLGPASWQCRLSLYALLLALSSPLHTAAAYAAAAALAAMLAMTTSRPGGPDACAPSPRFCRLLTHVLDGRAYFARCELRGALEALPPARMLLAAHPHGIFAAGWSWNLFWNFALHERAGRIGFLMDANLRLTSPSFRLLCDWYAAPTRWAGAATKDVIKRAMAGGESIALLPGGFQEATICKRGADRVYVRKRTGFIKYCLQEGYAIVPAYTFGESDLYSTFNGLMGVRLWLAKRNIPAVAMLGDWRCPLLPYRDVPLVTCIGRPLQLPRIAEPTSADVEEWHAKYIAALQTTFEENKAQAGRPDAVLELW